MKLWAWYEEVNRDSGVDTLLGAHVVSILTKPGRIEKMLGALIIGGISTMWFGSRMRKMTT